MQISKLFTAKKKIKYFRNDDLNNNRIKKIKFIKEINSQKKVSLTSLISKKSIGNSCPDKKSFVKKK